MKLTDPSQLFSITSNKSVVMTRNWVRSIELFCFPQLLKNFRVFVSLLGWWVFPQKATGHRLK